MRQPLRAGVPRARAVVHRPGPLDRGAQGRPGAGGMWEGVGGGLAAGGWAVSVPVVHCRWCSAGSAVSVD